MHGYLESSCQVSSGQGHSLRLGLLLLFISSWAPSEQGIALMQVTQGSPSLHRVAILDLEDVLPDRSGNERSCCNNYFVETQMDLGVSDSNVHVSLLDSL